jgi:hypothetical protein
LKPEGITVSTTGDSAKIELAAEGDVSITAKLKIELKAPSISIDGEVLEINGSSSTKLSAGGLCEIQGAMVKIN